MINLSFKKQHTPEQLVFGHDMIFPIRPNYNWNKVHNKKQTLNKNNNLQENSKLFGYDYNFNGLFLVC